MIGEMFEKLLENKKLSRLIGIYFTLMFIFWFFSDCPCSYSDDINVFSGSWLGELLGIGLFIQMLTTR